METKPIKSVKKICVIETVSVIGEGTKEDMVRYLYQYWNEEGQLLAEADSLQRSKRDKD